MSPKNQNIQPSSSPEKLPFWKASLIKALRGTIGVLETTAVKLETEAPAGSPEKPGFLQKLQQLWRGILRKIRLILPAQFSAKLTDTALSGIILGIVVFVFLITSNPFGSKPLQIETPAVVSTTNPEIIPSEASTQEQPVAAIPGEEQKKPSLEEESISIAPEEEVISNPEQKIPPVLEQKNPSPQEESISIAPEEEVISNLEQQNPSQEETLVQEELATTAKPIPLTPEQILITAIQNQIAEISNILEQTSSKDKSEASNAEAGIFSGIIESIQANFLDSNLIIKITSNWYKLEKSQQDKFAAEILKRSQELDFTHLEITDNTGKLIARNPVVGNEMVIFKRK